MNHFSVIHVSEARTDRSKCLSRVCKWFAAKFKLPVDTKSESFGRAVGEFDDVFPEILFRESGWVDSQNTGEFAAPYSVGSPDADYVSYVEWHVCFSTGSAVENSDEFL